MRKRFVVACSVLGAASMLAACGTNGSAKGTTTTVPAGTAPAGLLTSSELSTLVVAAAKQKFKVSYTDGNGDTLRYAQDGNGNVMQGTDDSESFATKTATVSCDKTAGTFQCTEAPRRARRRRQPLHQRGDPAPDVHRRARRQGRESIDEDDRGPRRPVPHLLRRVTSAGTRAARPEVAEPKVSATYCIDEDTGATLEVSQTDATGKSTTSLVVTKFEAPTAADFVPPVTPTPIDAG